MRNIQNFFILALFGLTLVACGMQDPAPVEYGTSLSGSSASKSRTSLLGDSDDSETITSRSFDSDNERDPKKRSGYLESRKKKQDQNEQYILREKPNSREKSNSLRVKEKTKKMPENEDLDLELTNIEDQQKIKNSKKNKKHIAGVIAKEKEKNNENLNSEIKDIKKQPTPQESLEDSKDENNSESEEPKQKEAKLEAEPESKQEEAKLEQKPEINKAIVSNKWSMPTKGNVIAEFGDLVEGSKNAGVNIEAPLGSPVVAVSSGTVVLVKKDSKFGNLVIIKHDKVNLQTAYAHLGSVLVSQNQLIEEGEKIGSVGQSGGLEKPMLHFAVREGKTAVDPMKYLQK